MIIVSLNFRIRTCIENKNLYMAWYALHLLKSLQILKMLHLNLCAWVS